MRRKKGREAVLGGVRGRRGRRQPAPALGGDRSGAAPCAPTRIVDVTLLGKGVRGPEGLGGANILRGHPWLHVRTQATLAPGVGGQSCRHAYRNPPAPLQ